MSYLEMTDTNSLPEVGNKYCQLLLEDMYLPYLETKGFPGTQWGKRVQDDSETSVKVHEIENMERNFEIVKRVFTKFCYYLAQSSEEYRWTFDNLIGILGKGASSSLWSRLEVNLLKNTSQKVLMYYLTSLKFLSSEEYLHTDVNLSRDVLMKALAMTDLSKDANSIFWLYGMARSLRTPVYDDSSSERVQQVVEKPWKDIQQTYLKILSELHAIPEIYLENLSQIPARVLYFCFQERILGHLPIVLDIIEESFSTPINQVEAEPEKDSETGEEWLEFTIRIKGEMDEVLSKYDKYTDRLVSLIPSSARYKMRLSYNII